MMGHTPPLQKNFNLCVEQFYAILKQLINILECVHGYVPQRRIECVAAFDELK